MSMMGVHFLGLQVKQSSEEIFINQAKYTNNMIEKFGVQYNKVVRIPMMTSFKMDPDVEGENVSQTDCRALIGSLLYLTANRPNITFVVGVCARFQADPKKSHLDAAKRILKYLKGTINLGLWYTR